MGDGNNKFFHRSILAKRNKNQIRKIKTSDGRVIEAEDGIRNKAEKYFQEILAPCNTGDIVNDHWQPERMLTEAHKASLIQDVDEEEIKNVIWNSKEGKAPDPDGFTLSFFKTN